MVHLQHKLLEQAHKITLSYALLQLEGMGQASYKVLKSLLYQAR